MASRILQLGALAAFASQALASCAHGTLLQPRAEGAEGKVNVSTFGYLGAKVSPIRSPLSPLTMY